MRAWAYIFIANLLVIAGAFAMPYSGSWPAPGHRQSTHLVLEGVRGMDAVYQRVSAGIDSDFYSLFKETFVSLPKDNHRILGHWGFSGAIPFNDEPYKSALQNYPKEKVAKLWADYVTAITSDVMKMTGLDQKRAQALSGLIYNTHILTDHTGAELSQLAKPSFLIKDISRNLHALFGTNSDFANQVVAELTQISKSDLPLVEKTAKLYAVLVKYNIGEKLVKAYEKQLSEKGISYVMTAAKRALYDKAAQGVNAQYFQSALAQAITTGDGQTLRPTQTVNYLKRINGVLQEVNVKGRKAYALSIPLQFSPEERIASKIAKELLQEAAKNGHTIDEEFIRRQLVIRLQTEIAKSLGRPITSETAEQIAQQSLNWAKLNPTTIGFQTGVMTFVFIEGVTVYRLAQGDIDDDTFATETTRNLGGAFLTGGATYCAVILGATPTGWVVVGIGVGVNVAWNLVFNQLEKEFSTPEVTMNDILGTLPTELQRRKDIWSYNGYESLYDYQGTYTALFMTSPNRPSVLDPDLSKPTIFDYVPNRTQLFH